MRNFSKRLPLLFFTALILANLAFTDGHGGGGGPVRAWRFVSASDETTNGLFQRSNYPTLVYDTVQKIVGVVGICNECGSGVDNVGFRCTEMSCGEEKDKAEEFVIKTLTQNGLEFVKGENRNGAYHIEGTEGNKLVLYGFRETTEEEERRRHQNPDGHDGDHDGYRRGGKKKKF